MKEVSGLFIVSAILSLGFLFSSIVSSFPTPVPDSIARGHNRVLTLNGARIIAKIVSTPEDIRQGLSDRESLGRTRGMLFELGYRDIHPFWMNRMRFSLDIIWIDGKTVVEIAENVPSPKFGEIPYTHVPKAEGDRVLELNAGMSRELLLRVGERIEGL
ncbi:MAG: DUF192 domain-containing protein [Patescibacteria group bacterium]